MTSQINYLHSVSDSAFWKNRPRHRESLTETQIRAPHVEQCLTHAVMPDPQAHWCFNKASLFDLGDHKVHGGKLFPSEVGTIFLSSPSRTQHGQRLLSFVIFVSQHLSPAPKPTERKPEEWKSPPSSLRQGILLGPSCLQLNIPASAVVITRTPQPDLAHFMDGNNVTGRR